jgi:hypothetical protein
MQLKDYHIDEERYAKCIEVSKRVRWDIDEDVIRGREFDFSQKFLPDGISKVDQLDFLSNPERRLLSQVQGRPRSLKPPAIIGWEIRPRWKL